MIQAGASDILYTLFGIVEHSGRLQGGHYTAYVKLRPSQVNHAENFAKKFYSSPTARNEEIHAFLAEIQRKTCEMEAVNAAATELPELPEQKDTEKAKTETTVTTEITGKWYHISDTSVVEVSEEKVLKCQAYLLFYERLK
jgi:ubiquitin carboxyl-terminal hydrolase 16/45